TRFVAIPAGGGLSPLGRALSLLAQGLSPLEEDTAGSVHRGFRRRILARYAGFSCRSRLLAAAAPELREPLIAAAAVAVELVAERILLVVVLVVFLGGVELRGRCDLRLDGLLEALLHLGPGGFGQALLRLVVVEDGRAVLVARIAELAVLHQRIDVVPEGVEQLLVADLRGI